MPESATPAETVHFYIIQIATETGEDLDPDQKKKSEGISTREDIEVIAVIGTEVVQPRRNVSNLHDHRKKTQRFCRKKEKET